MNSHIQGPFWQPKYPAVINCTSNKSVALGDDGLTDDTFEAFVIDADEDNPVLIELVFENTEIWDGTTPQLTVGTNSGAADNIFAAGDITEGTLGFYGPKYVRCTAKTTIYIGLSVGGSPTTGAGTLHATAKGIRLPD